MRRLVGSVAIGLIVGLAGCSGGGDKPAEALPPTATSSSDLGTVVPPPSSSSPSPTGTATPSASPTPTKPTKPTLPPVARQHSRAGAKAMAEYWLYAWGLTTSTGDSKPMWSVSRPSCKTCANFADEAAYVIREGGTITPIHRVKLLGATVTTFGRATAKVRMSYLSGQAHIRIPKTHQDIVGDPPAHAHSIIAMTWQRTHWIIDDMYLVTK